MRVGLVTVVSIGIALMLAVSGQAQSTETLSAAQVAMGCTVPATLYDSTSSVASGGEYPRLLTPLRIVGAQDSVPRLLFGNRDLLVISGGTDAGVLLGQRYFTRRPIVSGGGMAERRPIPRTTGWIRIVAANETTAIATVEVACDGLMVGDYLEPFVEPVIPTGADRVDTSGELDFNDLGRIMFGNEARRTGAIGDFMLIDRGSDNGVEPGARFAVYRDLRVDGVPLTSIGEGVVISTAATRSLLRIVTARGAVETGDYVVPRKGTR